MRKLASLFIQASFVFIVIVIGNVVIVAQDRADMKIDSATQKKVIDTLIKDLNDNYVFPELAKRLEVDFKTRWKKNEYAKITSAVEFADKLTEQLRAISKDKHFSVRFSKRPIPIRTKRRQPTAEEIIERENFMKRVNFGFEKVERLDGNVGYIELRGFMDHEQGAKTVEAAMNFLANTDSIIFDLRRNGGGSPMMVALISSYLFGDKPVHLNSLYWRRGNRTTDFWTKPKQANVKFEGKDIYILTSNFTFSAAEEFSYNLRNLKRAKIVGETTGGGANPGGSFRLEKHFRAFISTGRAISPITKTNWEGVGVKPHIDVPKEIALETAYVDALKKSLSKTKDDELKNALNKTIKETEKTIAEKKR